MIFTPVPLRSDFHVTYDRTSQFWTVKQEHRADVVRYTISKTEAIGVAIEKAREGAVSVVLHGMDGRIQQVWSYDSWVGPRNATDAVSLLR